MKKLTVQFLCLTMVIMAISVTETFAQRIRFKNGKATVRAKIAAKGKKTFTISGKDCRKITTKQKNNERFKYEIKRGSEFLSSGNTTGFRTINSDGQSTYRITLINESNVARKTVLSWMCFQETT